MSDDLKKFIVGVREVHIQRVEIEAKDFESAKMAVREGEGEYLEPTFCSHTLDSDLWTDETEAHNETV